MIKSFTFRARKISFKPDINFIIGKNGIGKTTLLKSIFEKYKNNYKIKVIYCPNILYNKNSACNKAQQSVRANWCKKFPNGASSGTMNLFVLFNIMVCYKPDILLLDAPENDIHISIQRELIKKLLKINPNTQIICATHSPQIISIYYDRVISL